MNTTSWILLLVIVAIVSYCFGLIAGRVNKVEED